MPSSRAFAAAIFVLAVACATEDPSPSAGTSGGSSAGGSESGEASSHPDASSAEASTGSSSADASSDDASSESSASSSTSGDVEGEVVFCDDFEYDVARDDPDAVAAFLAAGYAHAKTEQANGGAGYLYTTQSVPGFTGELPGPGTRVLALEARPTMYPPPEGFPYEQTDFYLQIGAENGPLGTIPADLWIQFWVYIADVEGFASQFSTRNKFFYPTASDPAYPSTDERWLFMNGSQGFEAEAADGANNFLCMRPPQADNLADAEYPTNKDKLYQNVDDAQVQANAWYLVKMHIDTSGPQGRWEAWIRSQDEASLTKIAEWIGGETPDFLWPLSTEQRLGLKALRIPTTVNEFDSWMYMDDLCLTTTEALLPTY
jgi:hypothetical protein